MTNESTPDATADTPSQPSDATSVERNKAVSRRWIEVFNERDDAGEADVRGSRWTHSRFFQQLGLVVVPGPRLLPRVLANQVKKLRRKR